MSGSDDRGRERPVKVNLLPLRDPSCSHYAPKPCIRTWMYRSTSMTVLLEDGWGQQSPTSTNGSPSPSLYTPSPQHDLGPEPRVVSCSIGSDDHIPAMGGLREMRQLGKSMDKVS